MLLHHWCEHCNQSNSSQRAHQVLRSSNKSPLVSEITGTIFACRFPNANLELRRSGPFVLQHSKSSNLVFKRYRNSTIKKELGGSNHMIYYDAVLKRFIVEKIHCWCGAFQRLILFLLA